jgi:hypothetical protein
VLAQFYRGKCTPPRDGKASGTSTGQITFAIIGANYERVVVSDDGRTRRGLILFDPIPDLDDAQRRGNYVCKP